MKRVLFLFAALMLVTMSQAQERDGERRNRREFNPEEMAQRQTAALNEALQLDSLQLQAVFIMNYADALTMQDSIKARSERYEKMRAEGKKPERPSKEQIDAMREVQKQREQVRDEQMKEILTTEQYEKYLKYKEEERNRRGRGPGMRRGEGRRGR